MALLSGRRIDRVDVVRAAVRFREPVPLGAARVPGREGWMLRVESEGMIGWGEAAPLPGFSRESPAEVREALDRVSRHLTGCRADSGDPLHEAGRVHGELDLPPSARFALELALVNLAAAVGGGHPARVLDPGAGTDCPTAALISGDGTACTAAAERVRDRGYTAVKMKVGRSDVVAEVGRVRAVAVRLQDRVALRLDANRAWSLDQALRFAEGVEGVPVAFVEEPLSDPDQLPRFAAETGMPVALDESLFGTSGPGIPALDGLAAVVLKPTLLGGLATARALAEEAAKRNLAAVVSAAFESDIGLYGLAALAASLPRPVSAAGLGTAAWLSAPVTDPPFPTDRPTVAVPTAYRVLLPEAP